MGLAQDVVEPSPARCLAAPKKRTLQHCANAQSTRRGSWWGGRRRACSAVSRGHRQLRGRLRNLRVGTGDRDTGGGRADDGAVTAAAERDADPLRACV